MPEPATALRRALEPASLGGLRLPHRIIMGAMHLGLEGRDDGGEALAAFYAARARGGAGLMVTGGAAVSPAGAGGPGYAVLPDARHRARLGLVAARVHEAGGLAALQLFHAGRYAALAGTGLRPVAPSAVYSRIAGAEPAALSEAGIAGVLAGFARGAAWARELGYDAVEIMASEGYLIDQFLSPVTNARDDDWGGDPGRRMRFGIEVLRGVRAAAGPDFPVIVRMSGADLMEGGTSRADALRFASALAAAGASALSVGIGWHESAVPTVQAAVPPGAWIHVAEEVKAAVGALPVIAGNRINRLELAESVLARTRLDFVSMARPFLADAELVRKGRRGLPVNLCVACNQACIDRSLSFTDVSCMVNPRAGRERELPPLSARRPARAAVIGGGPAGLQAAAELAAAGHQVDLYEAADALGGQFRLACQVPGKEDYAATIGYLAAELDRRAVAVHLGRRITGRDLPLLRGYDGLIIATGARPRQLSLPCGGQRGTGPPGAAVPQVKSYPDAFGPAALGDKVVIIGGGGVAVDLAHLASHRPAGLSAQERFLREQGLRPGPAAAGGGRAVTIVHRGTRTAPRLGKSTRWVSLAALRRQGVRILRDATCERVLPGGVRVLDENQAALVLAADTVVVAAGQVADPAAADLARRSGVWHRLVGGARDADGLDAVRAFAEGLAAARELACRAGSRPVTTPKDL